MKQCLRSKRDYINFENLVQKTVQKREGRNKIKAEQNNIKKPRSCSHSYKKKKQIKKKKLKEKKKEKISTLRCVSAVIGRQHKPDKV